jgi:hypothetical protein
MGLSVWSFADLEMYFKKSTSVAMRSNSKKLAQRLTRALSHASTPVLEREPLFCCHYKCAESLLLLYGRVTRLTYKTTRGFRTCKALPPVPRPVFWTQFSLKPLLTCRWQLANHVELGVDF